MKFGSLSIFGCPWAEHYWVAEHLFGSSETPSLLSRWALGRLWVIPDAGPLFHLPSSSNAQGEGEEYLSRENNQENLAFVDTSKLVHSLAHVTGNFRALTPWHANGWAREYWCGGDPVPALCRQAGQAAGAAPTVQGMKTWNRQFMPGARLLSMNDQCLQTWGAKVRSRVRAPLSPGANLPLSHRPPPSPTPYGPAGWFFWFFPPRQFA